MWSIFVVTLIYFMGAGGCVFVIRQYLSNRPPGLQTLFDDVAKDLLDISLILISYVVTIINLGAGFRPLNVTLGSVMSAIPMWLSYALFLQLFFVISWRYILIYHSRYVLINVMDCKC